MGGSPQKLALSLLEGCAESLCQCWYPVTLYYPGVTDADYADYHAVLLTHCLLCYCQPKPPGTPVKGCLDKIYHLEYIRDYLDSYVAQENSL